MGPFFISKNSRQHEQFLLLLIMDTLFQHFQKHPPQEALDEIQRHKDDAKERWASQSFMVRLFTSPEINPTLEQWIKIKHARRLVREHGSLLTFH